MAWKTRVDPPSGLVFPLPVGAPGGPTAKQARGPHWRRTSRALYVPASVDPTVPEQRIVEQAARIGDGGAITGWSSLRLQGVGYLDGLDGDGRSPFPVRAVLTSAQPRKDEVLDFVREGLDPTESTLVHGIRCATVPRALFDEMRRVGFVQAVIAMDMTSAAGLQSTPSCDGPDPGRSRASPVLNHSPLDDEPTSVVSSARDHR